MGDVREIWEYFLRLGNLRADGTGGAGEGDQRGICLPPSMILAELQAKPVLSKDLLIVLIPPIPDFQTFH